MLRQILNEDTWIRGNTCEDNRGNYVYPDSPNATKFDVYGALQYFHYGDNLRLAMNKFKIAYKTLYPNKYQEAATEYYRDGKMQRTYPIYKLNDLLDDFHELSRILVITDV